MWEGNLNMTPEDPPSQSPTHTFMATHSKHNSTSRLPTQATGTTIHPPHPRTGKRNKNGIQSQGTELIPEGKPINQRVSELVPATSDRASTKSRKTGDSDTSSIASASGTTKAGTSIGDSGLLKMWIPLFSFRKNRDDTPSKPQAAEPASQKARTISLGKQIQDVKTEELKETDTVIALMGPTGSGKSSFISTIAGVDRGVGHSLESCTSEINVVRVRTPARDGEGEVEVVLVDTPGFDDTHKSDYQILQLIAKWLKDAGHKNVLLDGILYLHRISDNRMAGTPLRNLEVFEKICGPQACSRIVMVTTMWDDLGDEETGYRREEELKSSFWAPMMRRGSTTERYNNTEESAWHILRPFIQGPKNNLAAVQLQKETVQHNRALPRTDAGQELFAKIDDLDKKRTSLMRTLKKQINRPGTDEEVVKLLQDQYNGLERDREAAMQELRELKIPVPQRFLKSLSVKARYLTPRH